MDQTQRKKEGLRKLFDIQNIRDGYNALIKPREEGIRTYLILMVACNELEMFINVGEWGSAYLYLRKVLNFEMEDFAR